MSHNITLTSVVVKDLDLLAKALRNLAVPGVSLDREAKTFRTFIGQSNVCEGRINMPGNYDIGLRRTPNGNYNMVADFTMLDHSLEHPQCRTVDGKRRDDARISRLSQELGLVQAEYEAAKRGQNARRVTGANGLISLRVEAR